MQSFHSNGKLLLTAEYAVLDGAKALALPTKLGQSLQVSPIKEPKICWKSYQSDRSLWISKEFLIADFSKTQKPVFQNPLMQRLFNVLYEANKLNPAILAKTGYEVQSFLEFPSDWGLGSSSTLLNNVAQWFEIDPFFLSEKTFGGSGYDVACASAAGPILYQLPNKEVISVNFNPEFKDELFFVHLNRKQDSREAVKIYRKQEISKKKVILEEISEITEEMIAAKEISEFEKLMQHHEAVIGSLINTQPVKERLFPSYHRSIKSLGGWGGDFILVAGDEKDKKFFRSKNFTTILNFQEMIL